VTVATARPATVPPAIGRQERFASVGSTNDIVRAWLAAGEPEICLALADEQTAGRGRLGRGWAAPPGSSLLLSLLLRPTWLAPDDAFSLTMLAAVALCEAVEQVAPPHAALKWPNDLLAASDDRKLAGILAQTNGAGVVIGIGLNVSTEPAELPVPTATSLALCGATGTNRTELLVEIARRIDARAAQWDDAGGDAEACGLADAYRSVCATLGRPVAVTTTAGTVAELAARGIDADAPSSPDGSEDFLTTTITDPDGNVIELVQWPAGHPDGMTAADWAE